MTRRITLDEFRQRSQAFFAGATQDLVVIEQDGEVLGALVSPEDYESLRRVRAQRAMDAMNALGKHMASAASPEELEDLVRELDTHNA
jgi:PHD/YefM family antitoxin component YafN of YafNO toxin-antitoxin module